MSVRLIEKILAGGIRNTAGEIYKDISNKEVYIISKDKRKMGVGRFPRTSSLLVLYEGSELPERIYIKDHMKDILIEIKE